MGCSRNSLAGSDPLHAEKVQPWYRSSLADAVNSSVETWAYGCIGSYRNLRRSQERYSEEEREADCAHVILASQALSILRETISQNKYP